MASDVKTMETPENYPAETSVPQDLLARLQAAKRMRAKGSGFYQGTVNLPRYTKNLVGEGFFITSDPLFKTQPKTDKRDFAQDVVQFMIRCLSTDKSGRPIMLAPELATLSGNYLLNQVRSMTINELHGYPWTIWQNELFTIREQVDGRTHPYMLELYDPEYHTPVSEGDSPLAADPIDPSGRTAGLGSATVREMPTVRDDVRPQVAEQSPARLDAWTSFNVNLRAAQLSLSDAKMYLRMDQEETWQGRDLDEDWKVIKALHDAPAEAAEDESPQEQIVNGAARGRGRPRKERLSEFDEEKDRYVEP